MVTGSTQIRNFDDWCWDAEISRPKASWSICHSMSHEWGVLKHENNRVRCVYVWTVDALNAWMSVGAHRALSILTEVTTLGEVVQTGTTEDEATGCTTWQWCHQNVLWSKNVNARPLFLILSAQLLRLMVLKPANAKKWKELTSKGRHLGHYDFAIFCMTMLHLSTLTCSIFQFK